MIIMEKILVNVGGMQQASYEVCTQLRILSGSEAEISDRFAGRKGCTAAIAVIVVATAHEKGKE